MIQVFKDVKFDWLARRRVFIAISVFLMLAGLGSAFYRQWKHPSGTEAFNLGVDFKGGTVVTGTSYRGAWDPDGSTGKWWQGWTSYAQR